MWVPELLFYWVYLNGIIYFEHLEPSRVTEVYPRTLLLLLFSPYCWHFDPPFSLPLQIYSHTYFKLLDSGSLKQGESKIESRHATSPGALNWGYWEGFYLMLTLHKAAWHPYWGEIQVGEMMAWWVKGPVERRNLRFWSGKRWLC
jgi:hypothetical protein